MSTDITVNISSAGPQGPSSIASYATYAAALAAAATATTPMFFFVPTSSQNNNLNTMYFADGVGGLQWIASIGVS